jgi:hypothetical protein
MPEVKPINVMLVDDTESYCIELAGAARKHRILIQYYDNLETAMEVLSTNPKFKFVIFDGKCFLKEGQKTGEPDFRFVIGAMLSINKIQQKLQKNIPYCINTGYVENVEQIQEQAKVFSKSKENDQEKMFSYIWEQFNSSIHGQVKHEYPLVYDFADTYFEADNLDLLISLVSDNNFLKKDAVAINDNLTRLRKINEHLMDIYCDQILICDPLSIANNAGKRTIQIAQHIYDNENTMPDFILGQIKTIYYTCSSHGAHNTDGYKPTNNTVASLTYGLIDIILWMNTIMDSK